MTINKVIEKKIHLVNERPYWLFTDDDNQVISISSGFASIYLDSETDTTAIAIFLRENASGCLLLWGARNDYQWWECLRKWPKDWPPLSILINSINPDEIYRQHLITQFLKEILGKRPLGKIARELKKADYVPRIRLALQKEQINLKYCDRGQKLLEQLKQPSHNATVLAFAQGVVEGVKQSSGRPKLRQTPLRGIVY